jgi:3(or 17)beta-hydroxysteroid dehydrogenase
MDRVAGKVALITGGAKGIGRACAELLAREGAAVAITDVDEREGTTAARAIAGAGGRASFQAHDVSREDDWRRVIDETVSSFGKLDILVNNAGVGRFGDVEHTTLEEWRSLLAVNLDGVFLGIRHAIPAMRVAGGGSIVNLSSIEGLVGDPTLAAYNASKGGVRLLTKSAALYCAKSGTRIRVNSVHPGYIWTPMVQHAAESSGNADEMRRMLESLHPVGHLGEPMDVAYGVLYLASDESTFVTGSELVIDGGYTAQ